MNLEQVFHRFDLVDTGCPAKYVPLVFVNFSACKSPRLKKYILRWCPVHAYFQTVVSFIPRCIKDKDNDQRANKAEIKTQI